MRDTAADRMRERERQLAFHERKQRPDIMFVRTAGSGDGPRRSPGATRRCSRGHRRDYWSGSGTTPRVGEPMRILMVNKYARVTGGAEPELAFGSRSSCGAGAMRSRCFHGEPRQPVRRRRVRGRVGDPRLARGARAPRRSSRSTRDLESRLGGGDGRPLTGFRPQVVHAHKLYPQLSVAPSSPHYRAGVPSSRRSTTTSSCRPAGSSTAAGGWTTTRAGARSAPSTPRRSRRGAGSTSRAVDAWIAIGLRRQRLRVGGHRARRSWRPSSSPPRRRYRFADRSGPPSSGV